MAVKFHRSGGFVFNNVRVDNTDNIYLLDVQKNATPTKINYNYIVPNRNGSSSYFNRYDDNYINVVIGIYDVNIQERRQKQRVFLKRIINEKGKLLFLDETNLFYIAEIIDAVEETETEVFTELTIYFKCSWCKYGMERDIKLLNGANTFYNLGSYKAENIITIKALTACQSIVIGNSVNSFTLRNLVAGEIIYVDSEKMIVYTIDQFGAKQNAMTRFSGQFFQIAVDKSIVTLSGTNYSATVNIKYNYTYITGR